MLRPVMSEDGIDLYLVAGSPFLYVESAKTLVMADLHLGFEEAASRGLTYSARGGSGGYAAVFLPRIQLRRALSLFDAASEHVTVKRVVINGDLKHAFDRLLRQEREEITKFVNHLRGRGVEEITVVRGNHDNFLKPLLRRLDVDFVNRLTLNLSGRKVLFVHGHEEVSEDEYDIAVIGHEHPSLRCFDVYRFPCLLRIPTQRNKMIVVMPATGPYHPGIVVTANPQDYLSPLIRRLDDLYSMSIIVWIELGEITHQGVNYLEGAVYTDLVKVEHYVRDSREIAVVEFRDYEIANLLCMT